MLYLTRVAEVRVSFHSKRTWLREDVVPGVGYCCHRPDHTACWWDADLGLWIRKAVNALSRAWWVTPAGTWKLSNLNGRGPSSKSSEEIISKWLTDYSCDVLAKNVAAFCHWPKNWPKMKFLCNHICPMWRFVFCFIESELELIGWTVGGEQEISTQINSFC